MTGHDSAANELSLVQTTEQNLLVCLRLQLHDAKRVETSRRILKQSRRPLLINGAGWERNGRVERKGCAADCELAQRFPLAQVGRGMGVSK
jgi:hypothetical protein